MLLAEAVKFDTGDLVWLLLVGLVALVVAAAGVAAIGTSLGFTLGRALRRRHDGTPPDALPRGSRATLVVGALLTTIPSWLLGRSVIVGLGVSAGASGVLSYGAAAVLPFAWGVLNGMSRSFPPRGGRPSPPDHPIGNW